MQYNSFGRFTDLPAVRGTGCNDGIAGSVIPVVLDPTNTGVLVGVGTYYFPFGTEHNPVPSETAFLSLTARWALAVAGTATIEVTNWPATFSGQGQGGTDVSDFDPTVGSWMQWDPTLAGTVFAAAFGSGNSMAKYTLTLGGTAIGGAMWNIPETGFMRKRVKLVTAVGGIIRLNPHGKVGG